MTIRLETPTRTPFEFSIDTSSSEIIITTQNGNSHRYKLSAINDLYNWLKDDNQGGWVPLGSRGEEETPPPGTIEEWARSPSNPVCGFYGTTKGRRGRFSSYIPSILEVLGLAEVEHNAKNNKARSIHNKQ